MAPAAFCYRDSTLLLLSHCSVHHNIRSYLRHAAAGRCDAVQVEAAKALVVGRHLTLALQDVDLNRGLVVRGGGEDLALLGRIVVLRSMSFVNTPPRVSMPRDSGVTSSRRMPSQISERASFVAPGNDEVDPNVSGSDNFDFG